jgi:hypothetical protein
MRWPRLFRRRRRTEDYVGRHRPGGWAEVALPPPTEHEHTSRVRLGFADGSTMDLADGSGQAEAFRRAAARLINDPR